MDTLCCCNVAVTSHQVAIEFIGATTGTTEAVYAMPGVESPTLPIKPSRAR